MGVDGDFLIAVELFVSPGIGLQRIFVRAGESKDALFRIKREAILREAPSVDLESIPIIETARIVRFLRRVDDVPDQGAGLVIANHKIRRLSVIGFDIGVIGTLDFFEKILGFGDPVDDLIPRIKIDPVPIKGGGIAFVHLEGNAHPPEFLIEQIEGTIGLLHLDAGEGIIGFGPRKAGQKGFDLRGGLIERA